MHIILKGKKYIGNLKIIHHIIAEELQIFLQMLVDILLLIPLTILVLQVIKIGSYKNIGVLGFTIEAGIGENPLPISQFNQIYRDNINILLEGTLI